jgi:hypothetical protein
MIIATVGADNNEKIKYPILKYLIKLNNIQNALPTALGAACVEYR